MVKLALGIIAVALLVAHCQAKEEANIISNTKIEINGKKVPFRGNANHTALHINIQKDILINNVVELVQAVYTACVRSTSPKAGKAVCRAKVAAVVSNGLNVIFDVIELTNHMLINGVHLGEPSSKVALGKIADLLAGSKGVTSKPPRRRSG